jgi:TonB family protein
MRDAATYATPSSSRLMTALLLSIAIHAALVLVRFPERSRERVDEGVPIEIAEVPPTAALPPRTRPETSPQALKPQNKAKELVKTEEAPNNEMDPEAKFLAEKNQKAEKQTKAERQGEFQAGGEKTKAESGGATTAEEKTGELTGTEIADPDGILPGKAKGTKKDWKSLTLQDLGLGGKGLSVGANDDFLRDVVQGDRTVLSTKEVKFFSYHYRIKELIQRFWRPSVQRKLAYVWGAGKQIRQDELTTKVVALLDTDGKLQRVSRVASCGITEVDMAAVEAFQAASPFPNPPKGMVEEDGFVRLYWDFIVTLESGPVIQFNNPGAVPPGGNLR